MTIFFGRQTTREKIRGKKTRQMTAALKKKDYQDSNYTFFWLFQVNNSIILKHIMDPNPITEFNKPWQLWPTIQQLPSCRRLFWIGSSFLELDCQLKPWMGMFWFCLVHFCPILFNFVFKITFLCSKRIERSWSLKLL